MASPGSPRKNSWKAKATARRSKSAGARWIGRIVSTLLAAALLGLVIYLLLDFPSWSSGNLRVLAVHLEDEDARQLVQVPFSKQDCHAFSTGANRSATAIGWGDADYGKSLAKRMGELNCQPNDVLLVYLTGIGYSHDGVAYLICRDSDLTRDGDGAPSESCLKVETLLKEVGKVSRKGIKTLLVFDAGGMGSDPRMGVLVNEFPVLLEKEVHKSASENLWVLNATALFQTGHALDSKQRSVFGQALADGLDGQADTGKGAGAAGDGSVRLFELYDYVLQQCAGPSRGDDLLAIPGQTPLLMRAGEGVLGAKLLIRERGNEVRDPVLVRGAAANPSGAKAEGRPAESGAPSAAGESVKSALRELDPSSAVISQARSAAPAPPLALDVGREVLASRDPGKTNGTGAVPPDQTSQSPAPAGAAKPALVPGGEAPGGGAPASAPDHGVPIPPNAHAEMHSLAAAWKLRDTIQSRQPDRRVSPIDFAPHLWRAVDARLLALERRFVVRRESNDDQRELDDLVRVLRELNAAIHDDRVADTTLEDPLLYAWNQFSKGRHHDSQSPADASVRALEQDFGDLCWQAVDIVDWFDQASLTESARAPDNDPSIKPFVAGLARAGQQLETLLQRSSKQPLRDNELQPLLGQIADLQSRFRAILDVLSGDRLKALDPGTLPAKAEKLAEDLLRTPLCHADDRVSLLLRLRPPAPPAAEDGAKGAAPPRWDPADIRQINWWEGTDAQWRALQRRIELRRALLTLAGNDASGLLPDADQLSFVSGKKTDEKLSTCAEMGRSLGQFYAGLPRQIAGGKLPPFGGWRLALLADGRDVADRRNAEARSAVFSWSLRVLRNPGRLDFAPGSSPTLGLFDEDFVPLRITASDWPGNLLSFDVGLDFDPERLEIQLADGKSLKPGVPVTLALGAGTGRGELPLAVKWRGPKSPANDARKTKLSAALVANESLAPLESALTLDCEFLGSRPVELAIRRHGLKDVTVASRAGLPGGAAVLSTIPGRPKSPAWFDFSLLNRTFEDLSLSVQLVAVPAAAAPPRAPTRIRSSVPAPPTGSELKALLFDATGKVRPELLLATAAVDGKPAVPLKPQARSAPLAFQKPKLPPPPPDAAAAPEKTKAPPVDADPAKLLPPPAWDGRHLACVITTEQPAWTWIYLLDLDVLPPREFLEPRVDYVAETQNVSVVLALKQSALDLKKGLMNEPLPVRLKADRDVPEGGIAAVLQGGECQLRWSVPADRRTRQFEIDVDGFPRAFRYKIVCAEGREGEEVLAARPAVRIRSLRSVSKTPLTYVVDPFALGDLAPPGAPAASPPDAAAPPAEKWLAPGNWAAFPADTREVEMIVAVEMPVDEHEDSRSRMALPVEVRLEDATRSEVGRGRMTAAGHPEFHLSLREDGALAVLGTVAERKFLVPVGNAPRAALSLVAESPDERGAPAGSELTVEDRVPVVVGPRPLDVRFTVGDRSEQTAAVVAGSTARFNITLAPDESTAKPRPNAGIAGKKVVISIKGPDDKVKVLKDDDAPSVVESDDQHWIAKWNVPLQYANQRCTLEASVFDGLGQLTKESIPVFVRNAAGTPVPTKGPAKGTIRIATIYKGTPLKSPRLEEAPGRSPVLVRESGQEYWEFRDLDLEQGYSVKADYFHDGTVEDVISEPNVKPSDSSDPKKIRVVPLTPKKKK